MATTIPTNPTPQTLNILLQKIGDPDPDFRFMALNDILTVFNIARPDFLSHDYNTSARTVDAIVKTLDDTNGEVQGQAIKCIGPMVQKITESLYVPMMEKLATLKLKNSMDTSIPSLAMRAMVAALPRPVPGVTNNQVHEAYSAISKALIPRLIGRSGSTPGLLATENESSDYVDVLIEVVKSFGPMLQVYEIEAIHNSIVTLMENEKGNSVLKKRAVVAISMLAHYLSDRNLASFIDRAIHVLNHPNLTGVTRRLYITVLGSMARSVPQRIGNHLPELAPILLRALGQEELEAHLEEISEGGEASLEFSEVREAALVALEAFLASCSNQMRPYTDESIEACLRYLKFDPNYAVDHDEEVEEEEEDDEFDDDDEIEADGGFDDDDDASWKTRRCAAKALHTVISTRSSGDLLDSGVLYAKVAPALVRRFDEREENVRLEVLSAMALLVRKTGEGVIPEFSLESSASEYANQQPPSRKRRRQSSAGGASSFANILSSADLAGTGFTSPTLANVAVEGPRADLAALTPSIIRSVAKLLKGKLIPTKQASINLLDDIVTVQRGGLDKYCDQIFGPIIEAIEPSSIASTSASLTSAGGNASATATTLRIAALRLTSNIVKNHSSDTLQPYLPKLVISLVAVALDRFYKISSEAIQTSEEVVKAITPPRSKRTTESTRGLLQRLYEVVMHRIADNDADAEVRQKAIHALGILLARTTGEDGIGLLYGADRKAALVILLERLKNETTRIAAVRAIDTVATYSLGEIPLDPEWIREVSYELAAQLRKSNRALRGSSIVALKHLIMSHSTKGALDSKSVKAIVTALIPVITSNDAQLLGPGLLVLAHLTQEMPEVVITPLVPVICDLVKITVPGTVLDSLLILVTNAGRAGHGKSLMRGLLLDVGISGDPSVVGKVIGTLLVAGNQGVGVPLAGGPSVGVQLDNFVKEVKENTDDQARASLGLAVLGEAGLRLGAKFPVRPEFFLELFSNEFDKVSLSAAVALGRAGAGNVSVYLPVILQAMGKKGNTQYLLLQSVKEILQQAALSSTNISWYSGTIWDHILALTDAEDNKAVCAECAGRLVIIGPRTYMPKLEALLKNNSPVLRAIAVQALRYTLPDDNENFDAVLRLYLFDMLKIVLEDPELEIRRHALSTLNSAAHNKPELIMGRFNELIPYVMKETVIKPELIREVTLGPYKHKIDDGLEVRKVAYETLYALMETAFSRISIIDLYDRIIAGLSDEHDIRALCNLMVSKLVYLDPAETIRRLDPIATAFRTTLSTKLKDTAVKQEVEKQAEANRAVLRVTLLLGDKLKAELSIVSGANAGGHEVWTSYWDWVNKDFNEQLKAVREEIKSLSWNTISTSS
ncbi:putative cullin-associated NEDD8-dissociated protein [Triangularia verruculosa]|uniref:Cullin-associated NEDD8-dissociated protein n=1 Tax=Triangularia verruculosa TaxID=2587418 RepID=A0AAN6XNR9_9PEZI|nr:putative cullin-associated NEDD8-dissociated protein [Triangularia verruculosa]